MPKFSIHPLSMSADVDAHSGENIEELKEYKFHRFEPLNDAKRKDVSHFDVETKDSKGLLDRVGSYLGISDNAEMRSWEKSFNSRQMKKGIGLKVGTRSSKQDNVIKKLNEAISFASLNQSSYDSLMSDDFCAKKIEDTDQWGNSSSDSESSDDYFESPYEESENEYSITSDKQQASPNTKGKAFVTSNIKHEKSTGRIFDFFNPMYQSASVCFNVDDDNHEADNDVHLEAIARCKEEDRESSDKPTRTSSVSFAPVVSVSEFQSHEAKDKQGSLLRSVLTRRKPSLKMQPESDFVGSERGSSGSNINVGQTSSAIGFDLKPKRSSMKQTSTFGKTKDSCANLPEVKKQQEAVINEENMVYRTEAFEQYQKFAQMEQKKKLTDLNETSEDVLGFLQGKLETLDGAIKAAREHYSGAHVKESKSVADQIQSLKRRTFGRSLSKTKSLMQYSVRSQLEDLHEYTPWFMYIITLAQLICLAVTCYLHSFAPIGLQQTVKLQDGIKTFRGTETIDSWISPNIWIGPPLSGLIEKGAFHAPCIREDLTVITYYAKQEYDSVGTLGCCEMALRNTAGTTTEDECSDATSGAGDWRGGVTCRARPPGQNSVAHILKPCCHGYMGHCLLATHEHCLFIGGQFQKRADHCSQVDCISILCGFGGFSKTKDKPYKPESINQWWRLFFGLLHHHGIFHWLMVAAIQLLIGRQIEKLAGWLRIAIIYILSGVFGFLVGAIFNPHRAQVGGGAAIFGLLGVLLVELIQSWELVANRSFELFKLTNIFLLLLFISTLPPLDNISHIAGTVMGCLSGIILLPYITFNRWHVRRKRILIGVLSPLVFGMMFIVLYIFYRVQPVDICPGCDYINCVPYFIGICD